MNMFFKIIAASAIAWGGLAQAHTVLEYQVATAGQSYKATFKVSHGCGHSPTRQIVVDIPAGVQGAKPMPKAGWVLSLDADAITWTASNAATALPDAHYDEFVLLGTLPAQSGMMYWPVQQLCEQGRNDWTEVPKPGQKLSDLKSPAAALELMPRAAAAGHAH